MVAFFFLVLCWLNGVQRRSIGEERRTYQLAREAREGGNFGGGRETEVLIRDSETSLMVPVIPLSMVGPGRGEAVRPR